MKRLKLFYLLVLLLLVSGCSTSIDILLFPSDNIMLEVGDIYDLAPESNRLVAYEVSDTTVISINADVITALKVGSATITATAGAREALLLVTVTAAETEDPITDPVIDPIEDPIEDPAEDPIDNPIPLLTTMSVYFIDIGQGDCIFIELPNRENLMIDAGYGLSGGSNSWANISSTLNALNVTVIDHLIITHNHSDHYQLVPDVIANYEVLNVYGSGSTRTGSQYLGIMSAISNASIDYNIVSVGDKIIDEVGLMLQVVATQRILNETDPNISSVMTRLVFGDIAFMFTGDGGYSTSNDAEYIALASGLDLSADVLKVGHHGSSTSSMNSFLDAVGATYGVLTTAENSSTGHPKADALARLTAHNISLYQTKDHGNIIFRTTSTSITNIETAR